MSKNLPYRLGKAPIKELLQRFEHALALIEDRVPNIFLEGVYTYGD